MSEHVDRLMNDLAEYFSALEADPAADEATIVQATEKIAITIGDNGLKPGDLIVLKSGVVYSVEPAYFSDGYPVNTGQLFCRQWKSLEPMETVLSDAEAHEKMGDGVPIPGVWDTEKREAASLDERREFLAELPELAQHLKKLALKRRDPKLGETAKLARKLADIVEVERSGAGLEGAA